jgi:outer membrane protein TolC
MSRLLLLMLLSFLAACAIAPSQPTALPPETAGTDEPDQAVVPTAWRHGDVVENTAESAWWNVWQDETLNGLVDQAMLTNPDILLAETRLGQVEIVAGSADDDEQGIAQPALIAVRNDAQVVRQAVEHAVVSTYLEARLADSRQELLLTRLQLQRDLTNTLYKRLTAGLENTTQMREQEQEEAHTHLAKKQIHYDREQTQIKLAALLGKPPVEFTLSPSTANAGITLSPTLDAPSAVIERQPEVQAAWQRLLSARATSKKRDLDDLDINTQLDLADAMPATRESAYQKSVLLALQQPELAMLAWRRASAQFKSARDALDIQQTQLSATQRAVDAGRLSRIELIKAQLAQNLAQENLLLAAHARNQAYAAVQLALAKD